MVRGFNQSAHWKSAEKVPEDRVVASTDSKVNIKLPAHWSPLTNLNEAAQLQAGNPQREEYLIIINDAKGDFEGSLEQYADLVIGRLRESLDGAVVSDPEAVSVNNAKGTQYVVSGSIQGLKLRYLFTILESDAGYHQVIEWTLNSKVESAFPVFREVLGTLSVSKAESS